MDKSKSELIEMVSHYADSRSIKINPQEMIGSGNDGRVWRTSRNSALKIHYRDLNYQNEKECYKRIMQRDIKQIKGLRVPDLIDYDDRFNAIEIGIVEPPYLLDFGKVYLDGPPSYWNDEQLMENCFIEWEEFFDDHWKEVRRILSYLQGLGIWYVDPKPANINFGD